MTITGSNTTNFGFQKLGSNDSAGYSTINEVVDGIDTILNASDRLIKAGQTPTVAYVLTGDGTDWIRGLVVTNSITDLAVTTGKINDLAVTTGKINDLAVTTGKIAASAVTAAKIESNVALPGQPTVGTATGTYPVTGSDSRIASVKYVNDAAASLTAGTSFTVGGDLSGTTGSATIVAGAVTSAKILDNTIVLGDLATALQAFLVPTGTVSAFAGSAAPPGYLLCNGDTVPNGSGTVQGVTTDFSALYIVLGTSFGTAGTLPNLLGRTVVGAGAAGAQNGTSSSGSLTGGTALTARTIGSFFGDQYLQAHTHAAGYTVTGTNVDAGTHNHNVYFRYIDYYGTANYSPAGNAGQYGFGSGVTSGEGGAHGHAWSGSISGNSGAHSMANQGAAGTVNANIQPSLSLTYIIKY